MNFHSQASLLSKMIVNTMEAEEDCLLHQEKQPHRRKISWRMGLLMIMPQRITYLIHSLWWQQWKRGKFKRIFLRITNTIEGKQILKGKSNEKSHCVILTPKLSKTPLFRHLTSTEHTQGGAERKFRQKWYFCRLLFHPIKFEIEIKFSTKMQFSKIENLN